MAKYMQIWEQFIKYISRISESNNYQNWGVLL